MFDKQLRIMIIASRTFANFANFTQALIKTA